MMTFLATIPNLLDNQTLLIIALSSVFIFMIFMFLWSLISKNNGYADIAWGIGIILVSLITFIGGDVETTRRALVTFFVIVWGTRLSARIFIRNLNKQEDFKYRDWRKSWGKFFQLRSFFQIYVLQGILLILVSTPIVIINLYGGGSLGILDFIGVLIWLTGFYFEARSDFELDKFKQKPENAGKILTEGMWSLSRHPNYFGESIMWFGISIIALATPYGFLGLISPLIITFIFFQVSRPRLEKYLGENFEFESYKRNTPIFIPKFSKKPLRTGI